MESRDDEGDGRLPVRYLGNDDQGREWRVDSYGEHWSQPGRRGGRPGGRRGDQAASGEAAGSCPSNTNPLNRQRDDIWHPGEATVAVDWIEIAGCIQWGPESIERLEEIKRMKRLAAGGRSQVWDFIGGKADVLSRGVGSGRDSHKEYALDCRGMLVAFSPRLEADRKLHNFMMRIPGETCLVFGYEDAWDAAWRIVETLDGRIVDDWFRRLDICIDVPGLSIGDELVPAFLAKQFLTTAKDWNPWDGVNGHTGFTVGKSSRLKVNVYDKVADVKKKHQGLYEQAMIDRRWNGARPESATRVEWQMGKEWFDYFGHNVESSRMMADLGTIVARATALGPEPRPFFCMTDSKPDRENRNQARCGVLPIWLKIVSTVCDWSGNPTKELRRIERRNIKSTRHYGAIIGAATAAASERGRYCGDISDVHSVINELYEAHGSDDAPIHEKFEAKARKMGTWDSILEFPGAA